MKRTYGGGSTITVLFVLGFVAPSAWAADLTGTWVGEQDCRRFDGTRFTTLFPNDVMTITQNGLDININAVVVSGGIRYQGQVINDVTAPKTKAQAAFTACGTTDVSPYQEITRATKIDVKSDGLRATFLATSIFFQDIEGFPPDVGTCEWIYQRVSAADPGVGDCSSISTSATINSTHSPKRP